MSVILSKEQKSINYIKTVYIYILKITPPLAAETKTMGVSKGGDALLLPLWSWAGIHSPSMILLE
jgi:hypothetical protein